MEQRRKFSPEFKREAVQLASREGVQIRQVAEDLGLHAGMLGRWCRERAGQGSRIFAGSGTAHDVEVAQLKRELARVKRERDFLKEAAAFFAKGLP